MKALEEIWKDRQYEHEVSYTDNLGLMVQPDSFSNFRAHPDFVEAFRLWTQKDSFRGLDFARVWSFVLNLKHVLSKLGVTSRTQAALRAQALAHSL